MSSPDLPTHPLSWRSWHFRLVLLLLVSVLAVRLIWGWQTSRTLRTQNGDLRRLGEPATVDDVSMPRVPDAENAWDLQQRAAQATQTTVYSPRASNDDFRNYPPFPDAWMNRAAASEAAHTQAFALARQARPFTRAQLRDQVTAPLVLAHGGMYNSVRNLANTVSDGALYSHVRGDDVEALERVRDVLHLAHSLYSDPFPLSQLVGEGVDGLAFETTQAIAPGLHLDNPATRKHAIALIQNLLDEAPARHGMDASIRMSRLETTDLVDWRARDFWLLHPIADQEIIRIRRSYATVLAAGPLRSAPDATAAFLKADFETHEVDPQRGWGGMGELRAVPRYSRWFLLGSYLDRYLDRHFRSIAERRATAVSLATQLYRADHGRWPATLDELAPIYLPAVPADPYHEDGRPLGYVIKRGALPGGGDRPLVYYDAGMDSPLQISNEPMYTWYLASLQADELLRQYRDLARFIPPPSPKAVDGDPEKSGTPRQQPNRDDDAQ